MSVFPDEVLENYKYNPGMEERMVERAVMREQFRLRFGYEVPGVIIATEGREMYFKISNMLESGEVLPSWKEAAEREKQFAHLNVI